MFRNRIIGILLTLCGIVGAAVQPAGIFTDGAVLQCNMPVDIWGAADPGEIVTVTFASQTKTAVTDASGKWLLQLDPLNASSEPRSMSFSSSNTPEIQYSNLLVGEVWLAGGQSNMTSVMRNYSKTSQPDIDSANDPLLRMVTIPRLEFAGQNNDRPQWQQSIPQNVAGFSAAAYYFAKNLREVLGVPVGIVSCSVGATPAEAWMSRKTFESSEDLKRILDAYETGFEKEFPGGKGYQEKEETYLAATEQWLAVSKTGKNPGPRPQQPMGPKNYRRPAGLHETMLTQTIPYTVCGVIWYQGENNAAAQAGDHYRTVFSALIEEWREEFKNPELPFLFVQLATFGPVSDQTVYWPELRDAQRWVEENVENTGMAVLVDGGEENNIHPHSKDKVGYRLFLLARNLVYGEKKLLCRGPRLKKTEVKDGAVELGFADIGSGLVLNSAPVNVFEICGKDGVYVPASAKLTEGKIVVSSPAVPNPESVRYGWKKWFVPTLFNQEGLPAGPFRTDNTPPVSTGRYYLDTIH